MPSTVRPLRPDDVPGVEEICYLTSFWYPDERFRRLGALKWVLPYVEHETSHCFVAESSEGQLVGYIFSTPDIRHFESEVLPLYVGAVREAFAGLTSRISIKERELWEGYFRHLDCMEATLKPILADYPSHLHINIHPDFQRQGLGHCLMDALLSHHRNSGTPGIYLRVAEDNRKGVTFYRKYGFHELPSPENTDKKILIFVRNLRVR